MIKNYLLIAVRNALKQKFFSLINALGMTIGVLACLLIVIYIAHELSYDRFHTQVDQMYQIGLNGKIGGQEISVPNTCSPLAQALVNDIPEVKLTTRIMPYSSYSTFKYKDKIFAEDNVIAADSSFFSFFSFKLSMGDPQTALVEPNSVVLTQKLAEKYFDDQNPVGQLMSIGNDTTTYKVTGIAENPPENTHIKFSAIISASSTEQLQSTIWLNNSIYTYAILYPQTDPNEVEGKFPELVKKYVGPEIERYMGTSLEKLFESGGKYGYLLNPVRDIHLYDKVPSGQMNPGGNVLYLYFFGGIGIFILLIACINFMNLSTARYSGRAKEVGLRKAFGSDRRQLIQQFLMESCLYTLVATALAYGCCYLLMPAFNILAGKSLNMNFISTPMFMLALLAFSIFVGLLAGSYPAFYLTSFQPVEVLKGKMRAGVSSKLIRSLLVTFQFALSIFLIIFTMVVYRQIHFMQTKNLGLDKEKVLVINNANRLENNRKPFRDQIEALSSVESASFANNVFPGVNNTSVVRKAHADHDYLMAMYYADEKLFDVLKFELLEGRYFSMDFPSDSVAVVLNEAAVKELGFSNPIGDEVISNYGFSDEPNFVPYKIIGVVKDFNFESFKQDVRPLCIFSQKLLENGPISFRWHLMVRYQGNPQQLISNIQDIWKEMEPNEPFEYDFLDQNFDQLFRAEQRMGLVFSVFTGLTIFVSCLGLLALSAFTTEQRTKELGVRKALGATSSGIVMLLSREYLKLVVVAFVPAAIFAYFVSDRWLQNFSFRSDLSPWEFIIGGMLALLVAWVTVSYQSYRAASANPIDSLRYE